MDKKMNKFDDVILIAENKIGMIYSIKEHVVIVKTASKLIKTHIANLKLINNG